MKKLLVTFAVLVFVASTQTYAADSAVTAEPLGVPKPAAPPSDRYDPQATAMLLNYCRESLYKITEFNDRTVLDEEYSKLINNIDVTRLQDDEVAQLIQLLLRELNALRMNEAERQFLSDAYNRHLQFNIMEAFKGAKDLKELKGIGLGGGPAGMACQTIVAVAAGVINYKSQIAHQQRDLKGRMLQLDAEELNRLTVLRTKFFDVEYKLYKRYSLPDRLDLKEVQLAQYARVLSDIDARRRLERMERLKDDFDAYPPFWYQLGRTAQEVGEINFAKSYYEHFERIHTHAFREDPDYVLLAMHRAMMWDIQKDAEPLRRDLQIIEENTRYYYQWENILFAALMYYRLGDVQNARRLIRMSINEGCCVEMHQEVLARMESAVAKEDLGRTPEGLLSEVDMDALSALGRVGPGQHLEALRALGPSLTGIRISLEDRSHAAQNLSYLVPGYNFYAIGQSIKGTAYADNIVVSMPVKWVAAKKTKVRLLYNGRTYNPSNESKDGDSVTFNFSRVFEQEKVTEKKQALPLKLRIEDPAQKIDIVFEARPVTPDVLDRRPDLDPARPYFEMCRIEFMGRTYTVDNGFISYNAAALPSLPD
jgi:hypothetical protein